MSASKKITLETRSINDEKASKNFTKAFMNFIKLAIKSHDKNVFTYEHSLKHLACIKRKKIKWLLVVFYKGMKVSGSFLRKCSMSRLMIILIDAPELWNFTLVHLSINQIYQNDHFQHVPQLYDLYYRKINSKLLLTMTSLITTISIVNYMNSFKSNVF